MDEEKRNHVTGAEQDQVSRALMLWLNQCPYKPVKRIEFEYVPQDGNGMGIMTITAAYKTTEYISGAYEAQYQFALLYRSQPATSGERLESLGSVTAVAEWAESASLPDIGERRKAIRIERNSPAVMLARYDDGSEDYQILMTLDYEVRP